MVEGGDSQEEIQKYLRSIDEMAGGENESFSAYVQSYIVKEREKTGI